MSALGLSAAAVLDERLCCEVRPAASLISQRDKMRQKYANSAHLSHFINVILPPTCIAEIKRGNVDWRQEPSVHQGLSIPVFLPTHFLKTGKPPLKMLIVRSARERTPINSNKYQDKTIYTCNTVIYGSNFILQESFCKQLLTQAFTAGIFFRDTIPSGHNKTSKVVSLFYTTLEVTQSLG